MIGYVDLRYGPFVCGRRVSLVFRNASLGPQILPRYHPIYGRILCVGAVKLAAIFTHRYRNCDIANAISPPPFVSRRFIRLHLPIVFARYFPILLSFLDYNLHPLHYRYTKSVFSLSPIRCGIRGKHRGAWFAGQWPYAGKIAQNMISAMWLVESGFNISIWFGRVYYKPNVDDYAARVISLPFQIDTFATFVSIGKWIDRANGSLLEEASAAPEGPPPLG